MALSLATGVWAAGVQLQLKGTKAHPKASGTAYIGDDSFTLKASGLRGDSVYTVWFVNTKPKKHVAGVGSPPYMFRTDSLGNGSYETKISESPLGRWEMIMVVLHPDGDPTKMKNVVGALSVKIPQ
jgi:hypothetical protein